MILFIRSIRSATDLSPEKTIENLSEDKLSAIHIRVGGREYYFIVGADHPFLIRMKDPAMTPNQVEGGIDLTNANSGMTVTKDAQGGVKVDFNPAMIGLIRQKGVQSAVPVILTVSPMTPVQMRPLLGFDNSQMMEEKLAKI